MAAGDKSRADMLYKRLTFIYATGGVEPARRQRFAHGLIQRLNTAPEAEVRGMATTLLDFGETGADAFAAGLAGDRRRLYLAAWPPAPRVVPPNVARAALAPLNADSDPKELAHVLNLAYYSFTEEAAPTLRLLEQRLPADRRAWVAPVLERVRHRAVH